MEIEIMSNKKITPSISTLVAELRIIKIGNKQMTMAVFNQLYEGRCFDKDFNIIHQVWGKVLYKDITWIVFQIGDGLRKMNLDADINPIVQTFESYIKYMPDTIQSNSGKWNKLKPILAFKKEIDNLNEETRNFHRSLNFVSNIYGFWEWYHKDLKIIINNLRKRIGEEIWQEIEQDYYKVKQWQEKKKALYEKLNIVDQLFIAV